MALKVLDPTGVEWRVSRQLFRRPRSPWRRKSWIDPLDPLAAVSGPGDLLFALAFCLVLLLAIVLVWPAIVFLVELAIAIAILGVRAVRGRWSVVATGGRERWSWNVRGGAAAERFALDVSLALAAGSALPAEGRFETRG